MLKFVGIPAVAVLIIGTLMLPGKGPGVPLSTYLVYMLGLYAVFLCGWGLWRLSSRPKTSRSADAAHASPRVAAIFWPFATVLGALFSAVFLAAAVSSSGAWVSAASVSFFLISYLAILAIMLAVRGQGR